MRLILPMAAFAFLAACAAEVPNSARGVGFGDYSDYQGERLRREAELSGRPLAPPLQVSDEEVGTQVAAAAPDLNNPGISDEQNFEAVSGRETIESDADRLARQRAARQVIQPGALPARPGDSGPNIVAYALSTTNRPGEQVYRRSGTTSEERFQRACADFSSADLAQIAFLEAGGPERDRRGMDPDGDGFACTWDPTPFRAAAR